MRRTVDWAHRTLGYRFRDEELLGAALTHRSAGGTHYERLEFLGDSILNFIIAAALYERLPEAAEGDLSRYRASLVKGGTLAEIGASLELGTYLRLGPGELKSGGFRRKSILADAFEALIGAMYLDSGFETTAARVCELYRSRLDNLPSPSELKDPKTRLQEWMQARGLPLPQYSVEAVAGESHNQTFTVVCEAEALKTKSSGKGSSRRRAEQAAADDLLKALEPDGQSSP